MPNPYFQFKKFIVYHDKCAMKVGTDGVLLGAWADVNNADKVLDIGTGSGLISLMIAQRCQAQITAIDINEGAYIQSRENFEKSPWSERLYPIKLSLQDFVANYEGEKFDLIVSNPPYFENSYKPTNEDRTLARHSEELTLEQLVRCSVQLLTENGRICLILPIEFQARIEDVARVNGLSISRQTVVYPKLGKLAKRCLVQLERGSNSKIDDELLIEDGERHEYSADFKELLKEYYLHL